MNIVDISKGGLVEIEVRSGGKTISLNSEVVLVKHNTVLVTGIKVNDQYIGFPENINVNFIYKSECKVFVWENVRVTLIKSNNMIYHKIDLIGDGKPYNRRGAYRQYIGEEMLVYVNAVSGPLALNVLIRDISETGFSFITKEDIDVNRMVRLRLREANPVISISGFVVRKEHLDNHNATLYGCKFNESNNNLCKLIAQMQTAALKKINSRFSFKKEKMIK